ncbi:glucose 1-dehydrogenase [Pseudomonas sp. PS01302]|uniref:SDR family NAD(P)-dependent oxidoreductase n=1 Tax=Pseudomonas sp. PS01302 TaxID=2991438 RepID=UPI00249CA242|nr:glucose 1-dehydrogenase [Pseudomonas sp. PS01302]
MNQYLKGKLAIVTGGGAGIGLAVAEQLAEAGASVFIFDRDADAIEAAVASIRASGGIAAGAAGSVADNDDVERIFSMADTLGPIDILINNAGVTGNCPAFELTPDIWNRIVSVNQTGTMFCALAAGKRMQVAGAGVIINLSSIYGLVAAPNRVAYSATKAAIIMMTKALAVEWAAHGIRVNCIAPGYVETPGTAELANAGTIDLVALRRRTPQQRLATPEDIANAVATFCDDRLHHVTGQVLAVDGGWSAYGYL